MPAPGRSSLEHAAVEVDPRTRFEILGATMPALFLPAPDQTIAEPNPPRLAGVRPVPVAGRGRKYP